MDRPKSVVGVIRGVAQTVHVSHLFIGSSSGTEYFVSFPTKTGSSPLTLLKQFVTLTGQKIRYLRIDGVKEFQSDKIKAYCAENNVVFPLVVAYNHTMQARVEGAIGCVNNTAARLCYTLTSLPVSGMTLPRISI